MSDPNQPKTLSVTVHGARDLYSTATFGKMDPYCVVTMGGNKSTTNVHSNGGKTPVWNQTFVMNYAGEPTLRFTIFDKDRLTADDYVGIADVALSPLAYGTRHMNSEIQVSRKEGKAAGYLKVTIDMEPKLKTTQSQQSAESPKVVQQAPQGYPLAGYQTSYPPYPPQPYPQAYPVPGGYPPGFAPPAYGGPIYAGGVSGYGMPPPNYPTGAYPPQPPKSPKKSKKSSKKKKKRSSSSSSSSSD